MSVPVTRRSGYLTVAALGLAALLLAVPSGAGAEQAASKAHRAAAARLAAGARFSCAIIKGGRVRCWGHNGYGQLGYGNTNSIGDDETPASAGPVDLGPGRTAKAIAAGFYHACALLDNGQVRCWGAAGSGDLGYPNTGDIGDDETPAAAGPVDLGGKAVAITAGGYHTCAILATGKVRCWGLNRNGQLGYGKKGAIGDNETPASVAPVKLGGKAVAIAAGSYHTCAILANGKVRCWGLNRNGQLGYGNTKRIGDNETPSSVGPVKLGKGQKAVAITAAYQHTCALLANKSVRCWGAGASGELGYGNKKTIGDNEKPASAGPVKLAKTKKAGKAVVISASGAHTCAVIKGGKVRCWGAGKFGELGYRNTKDIGDNEKPAAVGPVAIGVGRRAMAVTTGGRHTCALLDTGWVRCWGLGVNGQLGYGNTRDIGDNEFPGSIGPVDLGGNVFPGSVGR